MTVHGADVNMRAMDTSTTEILPLPRPAALLDTVEQCVVSAARCLLEQQLGFVPAWAVLGDYLDSAGRRAARVGVRIIATLAHAATYRGES
ncbi:hypothetical protein C5614_06645 [Massilia phosphatilytica]|nr:hypothetical protein C5614_06645 [Massilia phosphatilytica]